MKIIIDGSRCWIDNTVKWVSTESQRFVVLQVPRLNSDLVTVTHDRCIGSFYWQKRHHHGPRPILRMSVNGASTILSCAFWIIYVLIVYRHPFFRYWLPLLANTTATCSLLHPDNERQWSVNNFLLRIFGNLSSDWLQASIYQILAAFTGKNNSGVLSAAFRKWALTECQQF